MRVLVTDSVAGDLDLERELLAPHGLELVRAAATDEETLAELAAAGSAALLVCYAQITPRVIEAAAAGGAKVIARTGIGYDNIDRAAAARVGLRVTYVPDYCLDEVADHAVALLLCAARGVRAGADAVRDGEWAFPRGGIRRLRGRRLALVGVGQIGRRVAERARALGLETVGYDPFLDDWSQVGLERAETLEQALADADFVSLHAPLTPDTRHVIGERTIALMERAPLIVNTARGGLIDLDAALAALDDGRLGGLALDVTDPEPLPAGHPLRTHPRALVTPHMAYYSVEAEAELRRRACEEIVRALQGEPPRCPVPPVAPAAASGGGDGS